MIAGSVSPDREPVVCISVRDACGRDHRHNAIVDTGFTGWLTLPPDTISLLGLQWKEVGTAVLADANLVSFDVYDGAVAWDGQVLEIPVDEAEAEPLVGMALMSGYEILAQDVYGGAVTLRRM